MQMSRRRIIGGVSLLCIAIALLTLILAQFNTRRSARYADKRNHETYEVYVRGTFNETTNALLQYIQFLESHEKQLSPYRNMDLLLAVAHQDIAYMSICTGDETAACFHLNVAYERHKRLRTKTDRQAIPRSEFVQFVINKVERADAVTNVVWRSTITLNPVVVSNVVAAFESLPAHSQN
jgi:hypothetical protein